MKRFILGIFGTLIILLSPMQAAAHSVSLTWTETQTGVTFRVYRSTTSGLFTAAPIIAGLTSASFVDLTPACGTTYFYTVTAVDASGAESVKSNQITAVIPVCLQTPPPAPFLNAPSIN